MCSGRAFTPPISAKKRGMEAPITNTAMFAMGREKSWVSKKGATATPRINRLNHPASPTTQISTVAIATRKRAGVGSGMLRLLDGFLIGCDAVCQPSEPQSRRNIPPQNILPEQFHRWCRATFTRWHTVAGAKARLILNGLRHE